MVIDPRSLADTNLANFDAAIVGDDSLEQFDEHEPLVLEGLRLTATDLARLANVPIALDGCVVQACDLSNFRISGIKNSLIQDAKLRGTRFRSYVRNVVFERCTLNECGLRMLSVDTVTFVQSQLVSCDFYGSELTSVSFPGSEVAGVGFDRCTLVNVDLTQASDLQIGDPRTLIGAAICETQVPLIAARLAELSGIDVREC